MKINIQITDMSPEEAQTIVPTLLGQMKNQKVTLQQADGQEKEAEVVKVKVKTEEPKEAPQEKPQDPQEEKKEAKADKPTITHKEAKSKAVKKIQAGHRDAVKTLITQYAETGKVDDIPEQYLAEFAAKLDEIGA